MITAMFIMMDICIRTRNKGSTMYSASRTESRTKTFIGKTYSLIPTHVSLDNDSQSTSSSSADASTTFNAADASFSFEAVESRRPNAQIQVTDDQSGLDAASASTEDQSGSVVTKSQQLPSFPASSTSWSPSSQSRKSSGHVRPLTLSPKSSKSLNRTRHSLFTGLSSVDPTPAKVFLGCSLSLTLTLVILLDMNTSSCSSSFLPFSSSFE